MILLDTNIISEAMRPNGDPAVLAWLDAQAVETLYLSTIAVATRNVGAFEAAWVRVIVP